MDRHFYEYRKWKSNKLRALWCEQKVEWGLKKYRSRNEKWFNESWYLYESSEDIYDTRDDKW